MITKKATESGRSLRSLLRRCYDGKASAKEWEDAKSKFRTSHLPNYLHPAFISDSSLARLGMGPQEIKVFRSGQYTANIVKHWERKTVISDKDTYSDLIAALEVIDERAALAAGPISPVVAPGKCSPSSPS